MKRTVVVLALTALPLLIGGCATTTPAPAASSKGTVDAATGKSCYQCHRSRVKGPYLHEALASMECTPCHQTQSGDHQQDHTLYEVKDKSANLCWGCHDKPAQAKSVHPVIEAEGCTGCHSPHSAQLKHLLKDEVPDLCLDCHENKLDETKTTYFRDGKVNLHYQHAALSRIPCLTCHEVHASPQDHLLRPKGMYGTVAVTIAYQASDKGGNCTTSCHDQRGYQRK